MKDKWDILKIISDAFATNKWLFIACLTGISSMGVNLGQLFESQNQEAEKVKAIREVAIGFQNLMIEIEPKEVIVKSTCNPCGSYLNHHLKEYH